jgi:hypothetical protein
MDACKTFAPALRSITLLSALGCFSLYPTGCSESESVLDAARESPSQTPATGAANPTSSPGLRLLTRAQYKESIQALLGIEIDLARIPQERLFEGHGQIANAQSVDYDGTDAFYELGAKAAELALAKLQCAATDQKCFADFANMLLKRAFRGAAEEAIVQSYRALLTNPEAGESLAARVTTLIATALASPYFLYRHELGVRPHAARPGTRMLGQHEIATRLGYLALNQGPDDALLVAADNARLEDPEERVRQLVRLLDGAKTSGLGSFVRDWMGIYRSGVDSKTAEVRANLPATLAQSAEESFKKTIEALLFKPDGSFAAILTTNSYSMDADISRLLGIKDTPKGFELRMLNPSERTGILMHPFVLAAHTKESGTSPFPLGKFIYENLLCSSIGTPSMVPALPEQSVDPNGKTYRQRLEAATTGPTCAGCHDKIGPVGFAFLPFDPVGRFSATDSVGKLWDTKGQLADADAPLPFGNAAELSVALAKSPKVAKCVARRMFRWAFGHMESGSEEAYTQVLESTAVDSNTSVRALLTTIVRSEEFATVNLETL